MSRVMLKQFMRLLGDERGGEVIEYALILGLIIVATIATVAAVGGRVLARWNTVTNSSF